jgi:hypothetical protein
MARRGQLSVSREAAQIGDPRICRKSSFFLVMRGGRAARKREWQGPCVFGVTLRFLRGGVGGQLLFALGSRQPARAVSRSFIFGFTPDRDRAHGISSLPSVLAHHGRVAMRTKLNALVKAGRSPCSIPAH